jgi:hypothetical protein
MRIPAHEPNHCILHDVEGLIAIAYAHQSDAIRTHFDILQESLDRSTRIQSALPIEADLLSSDSQC